MWGPWGEDMAGGQPVATLLMVLGSSQTFGGLHIIRHWCQRVMQLSKHARMEPAAPCLCSSPSMDPGMGFPPSLSNNEENKGWGLQSLPAHTWGGLTCR